MVTNRVRPRCLTPCVADASTEVLRTGAFGPVQSYRCVVCGHVLVKRENEADCSRYWQLVQGGSLARN